MVIQKLFMVYKLMESDGHGPSSIQTTKGQLQRSWAATLSFARTCQVSFFPEKKPKGVITIHTLSAAAKAKISGGLSIHGFVITP